MPFSIKTFVQNICLFTFLLLATLVVDGKEKLASPHKSSEGKSSVPTLHVPWVYRNHPMLSRPALPLSLDPIRFTLHASKQTIAAGEEVEITITAQLLDIPSSAFFIFEDQKSFSLKLLLPQGFTQTGGDYQEFIGGKLSTPNSIFTKRIRGVFASVPENPCFVLLRGAYNANSSSVFEQKQVLCLASKNTTQATRVANCVSPVLSSITPQTICYGGAFYMVNTSVTNGVEVYYQWYNDNGSANNNTNSIAGENRANLRSFPTEPGIYKYKVVATSSENSACTASQSVTLTINAPPTITSTTGTNPNCAPSYGGTIAVTGAGGTTFVYSKDNGGNWVDLTGNNSQNEITRNTMLQSLQKDVAKVKITLEEGFGLLPGGEYIGEIRNESSPPTFEGLAAGTYAIRVKNENGCVSAPTAVTLTNPNAPAIFNVTGGGACFTNGAPIQLSGSATGINYYLLRNEVAVTGAIAGTGGVLSFGNYATEGTYTVLATNATTGCSAQMANTAVVSSGIPSAPTVDNEPTTVCAGQQVVLTTQSSCAGTLVWSPSGGTLSNDNKNYTVSPSANTSYSVKCQVNDCVSEASNSVAVTVTTLAAPSIAGESTRTLCPDTPVTLVASGCPSAVSWSYSLSSGAAGTLAATGSTLELTFTNSGIAAWNTGDVLSVRATCTSLTCSSQPSEAVEITKQASCTISTALADCAFYIKAADAQGTETTKLTRTGAGGSIFQLLTLSAQTLEGTSPTGVTYSWTGPGITTPLTTAQISATQVGEYKLTLSSPTGGGQVGVCELYITLSGTPCTIPTSAACGIPANITPSDQGGPYLTSLAPGDQFTANDYVITVTSVIITPIGGGGASFSGEGYARMKLTNGFSIDVPVVFGQANGSGTTTTVTPIKLNTCYQLVDGTVVTQYDPSWGNIADVDVIVDNLENIFEDLKMLLADYQGTPEQKAKLEQLQANLIAEKEALQGIISSDSQQLISINNILEDTQCLLSQPADQPSNGRLGVTSCTGASVLATLEANTTSANMGLPACIIAAVLDYTIQYVCVWGKLNYVDNQNISFTNFGRINQDVDLLGVGISCGMAFLGLDSKAATLLSGATTGLWNEVSKLRTQYAQSHNGLEPNLEQSVELVKNNFSGILFQSAISAASALIGQYVGQKYGPLLSAKITQGVRNFVTNRQTTFQNALQQQLSTNGQASSNAAQQIVNRFRLAFIRDILPSSWTTRRFAVTFTPTNNIFRRRITEGTNNVDLLWVQDGAIIRFANGSSVRDRSDKLRTQLRSLLGTSNHTPPLEAHHIIPLELMDDPVVQAAAHDGFHINDLINGIGLETPNLHNGSHPQYTNYIRSEINDWIADHPGYTPQQANRFLQENLIPDVKGLIVQAQNAGQTIEVYFRNL